MTTLTIEQALALASVLNGKADNPLPSGNPAHFPKKVLVCTDKRGVVFGTTDDATADPITLTNARMCLRWSTAVGGVFGLTDKGPFDASKSGNTTISASTPSIILSGVTAVFDLTPDAVEAWESAPVAGR
jgi:hypothetical protein